MNNKYLIITNFVSSNVTITEVPDITGYDHIESYLIAEEQYNNNHMSWAVVETLNINL